MSAQGKVQDKLSYLNVYVFIVYNIELSLMSNMTVKHYWLVVTLFWATGKVWSVYICSFYDV